MTRTDTRLAVARQFDGPHNPRMPGYRPTPQGPDGREPPRRSWFDWFVVAVLAATCVLALIVGVSL